ncbi:hypothetical protein VE01_09832 [Pseudogymnoascus verrucosus]|uniref:Thioredoxin reductase n=1 Tax=Pseudogymnoascus verrucosus TaxID=342668 RepID=A0A1B8GA17_9PEZI|nr:uncharacterized protein VE01_09832 [Pseudogymnoascus verrucosus]OBT92627.1 hypothetical protein VE01_09832 [Pseudogymnoascus verrucosus]
MGNQTLNKAVIDETLVASISHILLRCNIPCVLWGNYLLTIYGVPSIVDSIDFVVPDDLVVAADSALQNKGLADCSEAESCTAVVETRTSPPPAAHFHIDAEMTVSIYTQSSTLWFLPGLALNQIFCSPDFILASDSRLPPPRPGRGHGAFQNSPLPVYIPIAHRLLEAFVRLVTKSPNRKYKCFAIAMVTYIGEYVDGDGLLDEANVKRWCREFYSGLKNGRRPMRSLVKDLEASFANPTN